MRRILMLALVILAAPTAAQQPAVEALTVVQRLFDAMRAKDSLAIAATFDTSGSLLVLVQRDGREFLSHMSGVEFARRIAGIPAGTEIEERIWDAETRVDGNLATVWTPYAFLINGVVSHCGVDAVMLMRFADGWKIVAIADTRRTQGCEVPAG